MELFIDKFEGENVSLRTEIEDKEYLVYNMSSGYPKVSVKDTQNNIIYDELIPTYNSLEDSYEINFAIPEYLNTINKEVEFLEVTWTFLFDDNSRYTNKNIIRVNKVETNIEIEREPIFIDNPDFFFSYLHGNLDLSSNNYVISGHLYEGNEKIHEFPLTSYTEFGYVKKLSFINNFDIEKLQPSLKKLSFIVEVKNNSGELLFNNLDFIFRVNPSIYAATEELYNLYNRHGIYEVIPNLNLKRSQLLEYLSEGINYFNFHPPAITTFNGLNMKGGIRDGWLLCSLYKTLISQSFSEGMHSFDYSGSQTSLNVSRVEAIESYIGKIENEIKEKVPTMKKHLSIAGVIGGDGSFEGPSTGRGLGRSILTNTPQTRRFAFRRGRY